MQKKFLLTAFRNTSADLLLKGMKNYKTLLLPNDKVKDSEKLIHAINSGAYEYIISFGQRPNIKNKVHIETTAREGKFQIDTNFDYERLKQLFEEKGLVVKISHNAGTSFCSKLYLNGLMYITQNNLDVKMIFMHIPFIKNIEDMEMFRQQVFEVIGKLS